MVLMVVLDEVDGSSRRGCTPSRTGECREVAERVNGIEPVDDCCESRCSGGEVRGLECLIADDGVASIEAALEETSASQVLKAMIGRKLIRRSERFRCLGDGAGWLRWAGCAG